MVSGRCSFGLILGLLRGDVPRAITAWQYEVDIAPVVVVPIVAICHHRCSDIVTLFDIDIV